MDGVLCDGDYIPASKRNYEVYVRQPLKTKAWEAVSKLQIPFYIISSRTGFTHPFQSIKNQIVYSYGDMDCLRGILCGVNAHSKLDVANALGASVHIDDDATVALSYDKDSHTVKPVLCNCYNSELLEDTNIPDLWMIDELDVATLDEIQTSF